MTIYDCDFNIPLTLQGYHAVFFFLFSAGIQNDCCFFTHNLAVFKIGLSQISTLTLLKLSRLGKLLNNLTH